MGKHKDLNDFDKDKDILLCIDDWVGADYTSMQCLAPTNNHLRKDKQ